MMLGSPLLATALQHAWILPFGEPALIEGNHRLLGLDFLPTILFGSTTATPSPGLLCSINSQNDQQVLQHYCKQMVRQCNQHQLDEQMAILIAKTHLMNDDICELELIDKMLTKILLQADQQCCPLSTAPWSPEVQMAYMAHQYWSLKLAAKRTECNLSSALSAIADRLDPQLTVQDLTCSLSSHLRQVQQ